LCVAPPEAAPIILDGHDDADKRGRGQSGRLIDRRFFAWTPRKR